MRALKLIVLAVALCCPCYGSRVQPHAYGSGGKKRDSRAHDAATSVLSSSSGLERPRRRDKRRSVFSRPVRLVSLAALAFGLKPDTAHLSRSLGKRLPDDEPPPHHAVVEAENTIPAKATFVKVDVKADPRHGKPISRSSHGLSIVNRGRRLVLYGGEHVARTPVEPNQALWVADLRSRWWTTSADGVWQWRRVLPKSQPPPRVAHAQAAVDDRYVYIFGGRTGIAMQEEALNDLWRLDTSSLEWTQVIPNSTSAPPPEKRSFHRMVAIGQSLYVFGGCGEAHGRLADLHRFDIDEGTWHDLGASLLRGRGGANLLVLGKDEQLAIVGGFAGEETADGQVFDLTTQTWNPSNLAGLDGLRPRSVCASGCFPSKGVCLIFGGEVDPSARGHEGAGDFADDVTVFDYKSGEYKGSIGGKPDAWPTARGWSDAAVLDHDVKTSHMYVFGGLCGDDEHPVRTDDLWRLDVERS